MTEKHDMSPLIHITSQTQFEALMCKSAQMLQKQNIIILDTKCTCRAATNLFFLY